MNSVFVKVKIYIILHVIFLFYVSLGDVFKMLETLRSEVKEVKPFVQSLHRKSDVTDSGTGNTISCMVAKCESTTGIQTTSSQSDLEIQFYLAWQVTGFLVAAA